MNQASGTVLRESKVVASPIIGLLDAGMDAT